MGFLKYGIFGFRRTHIKKAFLRRKKLAKRVVKFIYKELSPFKRALKLVYEGMKSLLWDVNMMFRKSVTISTKQGVFTIFFADNDISRSLYLYGQFELNLILKILEFLRSINKCPPKGEGTIVDIGANNGVISIGALYTGELSKAIAIEPDPKNFSLLQLNVNQNGLKDRAICLPYAVSHQKGEVLFELSNHNYGDHRVRVSLNLPNTESELMHESDRRVITVQSDRLDNLLSNLPETFTKTISLVWVDVQGYEGFVFMGARNLLSKGIPVVSEIWPYGIMRTGMSQYQFCGISKSIWSSYWVMRRNRFVQYPIAMLDIFFAELGYDGDYDNVIFTQ